jgi:hypothetical protein
MVGAALGLLAFLALALGHAATLRPWSDEGVFANAGYTLATRGYLGTPVLEEKEGLRGIQWYTYWGLPFHLLNLAAVYKLFGFGLLATRAVSVAYSLLALTAVFLLVYALTRERLVAGLAVGFVAFEYNFLLAASFGRMDMPATALGLSAYAAYLWLRRGGRLTQALLVANTLLVLCGLTHPAAVLYAAGFLFLVLYYDRHQLRWRHLLPTLAPYLAGATAYGAYILQSPESFVDQIRFNATAGGRLSGLTNPARALWLEVTLRYRNVLGFPEEHFAAHAGPIFLKALPWAAFLAGLLSCVAVRHLRRAPEYRPLLVLWGIHFLGLALLEGQKISVYVIHITPCFAILWSVALAEFWRKKRLPRPLLAGAALLVVAIQAGGILLKIRIDTLHNNYAPVVAFLQRTVLPGDIVVGNAALGFGYSFDRGLLDDSLLGCRTQKAPAYLVLDEVYRSNVRLLEQSRHPCAGFIARQLGQEYVKVYDRGFYQVLARAGPGPAR